MEAIEHAFAIGFDVVIFLLKLQFLCTARALELFPSQHALLARKKDHGRAEAALLVVASLVQS